MRKALHGMALLAGALLVLMISVGPSDLGEPLGRGWGRFFLVMSVAIVGGGLYSWWMYHVKPRSEPSEKNRFPRHQVESHKVQELHRLLKNGRVPTSEQARIFAMAIIEPTLIRRRMVEDYTPQGRTLAQSTKVEVHLPSYVWKHAQDTKRVQDSEVNGQNAGKDDGSFIYLPTAVVPKGVLLDGFRVFSSSGETMNCLTYRDYLMLVAGTLRVLLTAAYKLDPGDPLPQEATTAEFAALAAIIHRLPSCGHHTPDLTAANAIALLDTPHAPSRTMAYLLVEKLITNYAVVTMVAPPRSGRFSFNWTQTFIPDLKVTSSRTRRLSLGGLTRIGLGARPVDLILDIANAGTAQSYHLHVNTPEGLYLARQETVGMQGLLTRWATDAPTLPHCRFRRRLGQPHAHFYSRYMPRARADEQPRVRFRFFEVPPGTLMRAAVTALACAAIVWIVAFVSSQNPAVDTDAPAFLLAFPALAAAWLGFEAPNQRLLEGTLSTRICLVVSAALSISSSGLFMAHKAQAGRNFDWPMLPDGVTVLGVTDLTWAVVTGIALVNVTLISYKYVIRTWEFMRLASRTDQ